VAEPTDQSRDWLSVAFYPSHLHAICEIGEQHIFAQAGGEYAPILAERKATARVDGLQSATDGIRRLYCCTLGHGVVMCLLSLLAHRWSRCELELLALIFFLSIADAG
jgi:hypothetical protein